MTGLDNVDLWVGGLGEVTNLNGGLLGSTFNYVFQNTLENLQDFDRLYYLNRTQGMNLRTQLEGNSFAELIERNTDGTRTLKADAFATADCKFELANLTFRRRPPARRSRGPARSADDPNTGLQREPAAAAQAGRHDPVPRPQHRRPDRHQRPGRLQRHRRRRPHLRRQRQRHPLGQRGQRHPRGQRRRRRRPRRRRQRHHHRPRRRRRPRGRRRQRRHRRRPRRRHHHRRQRQGLHRGRCERQRDVRRSR